MTGVSVSDKRFVMAPAGAQRARPAGVAIVLTVDVAAIEKIGLLWLSIHAGLDIAERVRVGIDEAVAGRDIARGADAHQTQGRRRTGGTY